MKKDIENHYDIETLVDSFYTKVVVDPTIGFIFTEVIQLSWQHHIPVMYSFWESILLGNNQYNGNPILKHLQLDSKVIFTKVHFDKWLELWELTIHENFDGAKAQEAIKRAQNIAAIMLLKIEQSRIYTTQGAKS